MFGAVGFGFASAILAVGRACGIFEFWLEKLPGELLAVRLGPSTDTVNWVVFFVLGGLLGLAYRAIFRVLGHAGWISGAAIGFAQWIFFGIVVALSEPRLPAGISFLPASSPLHSMVGLMLGVFLLSLNCIFGAFIGLMARRSPTETKEEREAERAAPHAGAAPASKAA